MMSPEDELRAKVAELEASLKETHRKLRTEEAEVEAYEGLLKLAMEDMHRIYDDLLQTHSRLTQSDKMAALGLLSAGVVHEIKNPLMVIQGTFVLLKDRLAEVEADLKKTGSAGNPPLFEEIRRSIDQGNRCTASIAKIVRDIRVFSRSDKGEKTLESVNEILDGIISIAWNAMKHKAELKKNYGDLPKINCNAQQLGQVFLNIIVNAAEAMEGRGTISVKTFREDASVVIQISDTGSGISPEIQKRIFEPFFTTKDAERGTGLGLSVSADIVKAHEGKLAVESEVGRGTTFIITLPAGSAAVV